MQPTAPAGPAAIPVPDVATDEPVAVIPTASVAPLEGRPDGDRINVFTLAPQQQRTLQDATADAVDDLRGRVLERPLTWAAIAFSLGAVFARVLR